METLDRLSMLPRKSFVDVEGVAEFYSKMLSVEGLGAFFSIATGFHVSIVYLIMLILPTIDTC
jgi:hypothetical protein